MDNIFGKMEVYTRETSSKELDMDMGYGKMSTSNTKGTIGLTKKKGLGYIYGKISRYTKESSEMILDKVMANSIPAGRKESSQFTKDAGRRGRNRRKPR